MLEMRHVSHRYEKDILVDQSFQFPATGFIGISGESGCGKTTLLYILAGLLKPDEGEIFFQHQSLTQDFLGTHVTMIRQNNDMIPSLNVEDNIEVGCKIAQLSGIEKLPGIIHQLDIKHCLKKYPHELSVGQRKRVSIARSLLKDSDIILADEPTGALHQEAGHEVMRLLKKASKQALVLIVSHDESLLEMYCDEIVTLEAGQLKGEISEPCHENIKERKKKHYSLWPYAVKEVFFRIRRLCALICFQVILLSSLLFMVEGLNGLRLAMHKSVAHAPLKDIYLVSRKDQEDFSLSGQNIRPHFLGESGSIKELPSAMVAILPQKTMHIVLKSGRMPEKENECLISASIASKVKDQKLTYLLDEKESLKVVGVVQEYFFVHPYVYLPEHFVSAHPEYLTHSIYEVEGKSHLPSSQQYVISNDVLEERENYEELIKIGKMAGGIFVAISLLSSLSLMKIVFQSIALQRRLDNAIMMTLGMKMRQLFLRFFEEGMIIGISIITMSYLLTYFLREYLNTMTAFTKTYHFSFTPLVFYYQGDFYLLLALFYILLVGMMDAKGIRYVKKKDIVDILREED